MEEAQWRGAAGFLLSPLWPLWEYTGGYGSLRLYANQCLLPKCLCSQALFSVHLALHGLEQKARAASM